MRHNLHNDMVGYKLKNAEKQAAKNGAFIPPRRERKRLREFNEVELVVVNKKRKKQRKTPWEESIWVSVSGLRSDGVYIGIKCASPYPSTIGLSGTEVVLFRAQHIFSIGRKR